MYTRGDRKYFPVYKFSSPFEPLACVSNELLLRNVVPPRNRSVDWTYLFGVRRVLLTIGRVYVIKREKKNPGFLKFQISFGGAVGRGYIFTELSRHTAHWPWAPCACARIS